MTPVVVAREGVHSIGELEEDSPLEAELVATYVGPITPILGLKMERGRERGIGWHAQRKEYVRLYFLGLYVRRIIYGNILTLASWRLPARTPTTSIVEIEVKPIILIVELWLGDW